jgi:tetratricopeptide (TPR) repeat protein
MRGNLEKASEFCTEARALGEKIGDADIVATALNGLGIVAGAQNDEAAARVFLEEGLRVSQASKNQRFIGLFLNNLGEHARRRGDYAEARRLYEGGLAIQRERGNTRIVAIALGNLGRVSFLQNDFDAAREFYAESLEINRSLGDLHSIALLLDGFAGLAADAQPARAAELLGAANALRQTVGSHFDKADAEFYERIYQKIEANLEKEDLAKHLRVGGALKLPQAVSLALDV